MFTITTGHEAHHIQSNQTIDMGRGAIGTPVVMVMVDNHPTERYKFVSFVFTSGNDSPTIFELITVDQLRQRREALTAEVVDPQLGKTILVAEWSTPAREAHAVCQTAIFHLKALLSGGLFELPETF